MKYRVTKINLLKTKLVLFINKEIKLELPKTALVDLSLYKGKEFDDKFYKRIKEYTKEENLFDFVVKKLKIEKLTSGKVKEILIKKNANKITIDKILSRLEKCGLLNDEEFVNEYLEHAQYKHYGFNKVIKKLYEYKINPKYISQIKYNEINEYKLAKELVKLSVKKYESYNYEKQKQFVYSLLVRNGFYKDISLQVCDEIIIYNKKHELNVLKLEYSKLRDKFKDKYKRDDLKEKLRQSLLNKGFKFDDIKCVEEK